MIRKIWNKIKRIVSRVRDFFLARAEKKETITEAIDNLKSLIQTVRDIERMTQNVPDANLSDLQLDPTSS